MNCEELTSKYISFTEKVLAEIMISSDPFTINKEIIDNVIEHAKAYVADAKYYRSEMRFDVSLASIAYCEGLLDALKMFGAVMFEWPTSMREGREG
jgi:hypothetical protein